MTKQEMKFWARVFENAPEMSSGIMQGWIENPKALKKFLSDLVPEKNPALESFGLSTYACNPCDFFQTCKGLWVSNSFKHLLLRNVLSTNMSVQSGVLHYTDSTEDMTDKEINVKFPKGYAFKGIGPFLVYLAGLIKVQWGGRGGTLLANSYSNVFHIQTDEDVLCVNVNFHTTRKRWECDAHHLGDGSMWVAGHRIFSAVAG